MDEFFRQLISQLTAIWQKLSIQQRIIISSLVGFMFFGLLGLVLWSSSGTGGSNLKPLYSSLSMEDIASITAELDQSGYKYEIGAGGSSLLVESSKYYDIKMLLAREELIPHDKGVGWEIFNKPEFGRTDFEMKLKKQRAIEGELVRTIQAIDAVENARVHIVPTEKSSLALPDEDPAKATVFLSVKAAKTLAKRQARGIANLVASAVGGLEVRNITIVDSKGNMILQPHDENDPQLVHSRNFETQYAVELNLEKKVISMLNGILGKGKSNVKVSADLDFNKVETKLKKFDPESKVAISEESNETTVKNAPDGDQTNERRLTNYEVDKTEEHVIGEVGNIKRLTVSVAIDGKYIKDDEGKEVYEPRDPAQIANFEDIVKKAVGFDASRGDEVTVLNMAFDRSSEQQYAALMQQEQKGALQNNLPLIIILIIILILIFIMVLFIARGLLDAMNPPLPEVEIPNLIEEEEEVIDVPDEVARSNELLEKVEIMTSNDPANVARIIVDWLNESPGGKKE